MSQKQRYNSVRSVKHLAPVTRKVLSLESDLTEIKKNKISGQGTEDKVLNTTTEGVNEKGIDVKAEPSENWLQSFKLFKSRGEK